MKSVALALLVAASVLGIACKKAAPQPAAVTTAGTTPAPGTPLAAKPVPAQLPAVLARVNGEAIERWEFDSALKRIEARAGSPVPAEKRDEAYRGVIDQLVAFHLIAQEARARKMNAADTDIDARLAQIKHNFPSEDAFRQGIAAQGLTLENLRSQTRSSLEVSKFIDAEVNAGVAITDAEVGTFYPQNLGRFK